MSFLSESLQEKWKPILDHESMDPITNAHIRATTAICLENLERESASGRAVLNGQSFLGEDAPTNATAGIDNFDPVLISLVRRAMPNLIAYDICGVQAMTGPSGLIFALKAHYANQSGDEAFYNEAETDFATIVSGANTLGLKHTGTIPGNTTVTANLAEEGLYNFGGAMDTATGEALGSNNSLVFPEMAISLDKITVTADTRKLKAEYSLEMAQDLKAIHGLDAESELANILSGELLAEINREVIRSIIVTAERGATAGTTTTGIFDLDTDSNGRWSVEKFKGLMFQIEREANAVAKATRRGKANILICSSDVASALSMAGILDNTPALAKNNINVDDTGNTFAGIINGRYRVYIDPYTTGDYLVVGYKGSSPYDAGFFYCPYVPLQMVRAVNPDTFQPKLGYMTRYAVAPHPFAKRTVAPSSTAALEKDSNCFYRRILIRNLL